MKTNLFRIRFAVWITGLTVLTGATGCASMKKLFAVDTPVTRQPPIQNPFTDYSPSDKGNKENVVLRTKKGDRSVEVEFPGGTSDLTEFVVPMSPAFKENGRGLASVSDQVDENYKERRPTLSDREIVSALPQTSSDNEGARREVETGLGLGPSDDSTPIADQSYLATVDHIKQLFKSARYEAALLETDELLRAYPTDPKLYEMRGTLFERTGRTDLALKSWNQALRLDPNNPSLKRFVERKQQKRSLASP